MVTFIVILLIAETLLIGSYSYMKPRGGLRSLFVRENSSIDTIEE